MRRRLRDRAGCAVHEARKPKASTGGAGSVLSMLSRLDRRAYGQGRGAARERPRLLHVDGIDVEAPLEQNLIYLRNHDVPGVIGKIGTILGEESSTLRISRWGGRSRRRVPDSRVRRLPWCTWMGLCRSSCWKSCDLRCSRRSVSCSRTTREGERRESGCSKRANAELRDQDSAPSSAAVCGSRRATPWSASGSAA